MVPLCGAGRTAIRGRNHRRDSQPQHGRRAEVRTKRPGPPPFSPIMARPRALVDCHENSFSVDVGSCGLGLGFEGDAIAEAFEAAFEIGDGSSLADLVEVGFSEVAIRQPFGEHVIGGEEDFMGDGEGRAHGAAAGLETVELVLEIAALGSRRGHRGADQDGAQMDVALASPAAPALS